MTAFEWISIAAIVISPIAAVQVQKAIEASKERGSRRIRLFHTLMATRGARTSFEHVQALNMIDLEFYGSTALSIRRQTASEKAVVAAWNSYRDILNNHPRAGWTGDAQDTDAIAKRHAQVETWSSQGEDRFVRLLTEMSKALGYEFDSVTLSRGVYTPEAHVIDAMSTITLRKWMLGLADGTERIPIQTVESEEEIESNKRLAHALMQLFDRVQVIGAGPSPSKSGGDANTKPNDDV